MDEKTPHIHATVIPIVTGERRKANKEVSGKKKYRTKSADKPRLCADDVMSRVKLKEYQDTYAEAMNKYGLQRGIEGSTANHISTRQFYTNAINNHENLQEEVGMLSERKENLRSMEQDWYDNRDEARVKFDLMDQHVKAKGEELAKLEEKIEKLQRETNPDKNKEDLELLLSVMPTLNPILKISRFCIGTGIPKGIINEMIAGKPKKGSGRLYSYEYERHFQVENAVLRIEKDPLSENFIFKINGQDHIDWFRQQYVEDMKKLGVDLDDIANREKQGRSRGI